MSDFVKEIHAMFDHIWDCEIDHPVFQDTVGELMEAVIQTYEKHKPTLGTNLAEVGTDCISRRKAINALTEWSYDNKDDRDAVDVINGLPPIQPEIVRCKDCKHWDGVDTCDVIDAPVWDNDFCSMAERRTDE